MHSLRGFLAVAFLLAAHPVPAQLNNDTSPTSQFRSRPDLHPPIIDFAILRPELVTPGYIFLAPYRNVDPGPYIYDNWGNLVWSGAGFSGPKVAHTPRVCQYKGEDHLCYFEGQQHQGFARGHGVIMNKHYQVVKTVVAAGAGASSDMHEFKMTPFADGTTALLTVYQPRQYDLGVNPRFNVHNGMGWIVEGVFQEIEIDTGRLLFEWRSLDHVDPGESWTMPGTTDTSGDGLHERTPWDYFHLNSVDKNADGDYLISARHASAIYKLSGRDGSIIWQLGGANPSFKQLNFVFSYQHHARWISENSTHTVLSFFDNASNAFNSSSNISHGWIVEIDHVNSTAKTIKTWKAPEPEGGMRSGSQGNLQLLPNGGCHIGWGEHAYFSEHTADGTAVQYGKVAQRASNVMIYRSNKFNWTGEPLTRPALWAYSKYGRAQDRMAFFASWNGATEVRTWRFYVASNSSGPFHLAGSRRKDGFETVYRINNASAWAYAEAIDGGNRTMQTSPVVRTFVPSEKLRPFCGSDGCRPSERVEGSARVDYNAHVDVDQKFLSPNRGFDTSDYYRDGEDRGAGGGRWFESGGNGGTSAGATSTSSQLSVAAAKLLHGSGATSSTGSNILLLVLGLVLGLLSSCFASFFRKVGGVVAGTVRPNTRSWLDTVRSRRGNRGRGGLYTKLTDRDADFDGDEIR